LTAECVHAGIPEARWRSLGLPSVPNDIEFSGERKRGMLLRFS
jgi:hypothetical protein